MTLLPLRLECRRAAETTSAGRELASSLRPGDCVLLEGDLASGKTTFARGVVGGLGGHEDEVSSPTFVIVQNYPCDGPVQTVHHIDLYRLPGHPEVLTEIGVEELLSAEDAVTLIEWPGEKVRPWLPPQARVWQVRFEVVEDGRVIEIESPGGSAA